MAWPVGLPIRLVRGFKPKFKKHHGLDLDGETGDFIYASHSGQVIYANQKQRGYGKLIILKYDAEWSTYYAHLSKFAVAEGDFVSANQILGKMGQTGNARGSHLHFELRRYDQAVDPFLMLPDLFYYY